MTYSWTRYDRATGELFVVLEDGEPCLCCGDDLPHPAAAIVGCCFEAHEAWERAATDPGGVL